MSERQESSYELRLTMSALSMTALISTFNGSSKTPACAKKTYTGLKRKLHGFPKLKCQRCLE